MEWIHQKPYSDGQSTALPSWSPSCPGLEIAHSSDGPLADTKTRLRIAFPQSLAHTAPKSSALDHLYNALRGDTSLERLGASRGSMER